MPFQLKIIIVAIVSYFLGNISPAILVGRLHGIDIRKEGQRKRGNHQRASGAGGESGSGNSRH